MAADEKHVSSTGDEKRIIPGFQDADAAVQSAFRSLIMATKASNELPSAGDDYDYYSSFGTFKGLMDVEGQRILHLVQNVMRYHGAKGNLSTSSTAVEIEDKFDVLIDANDQILERVGNFLDEAAGIKKNDAALVIASISNPRHISGSWNKKKLPGGGGTNYRLLAAKHVQRPQIKFKDKVDNSLRAFVPKITWKPHAMKPIPESIYQAQQEKEKVSTTEDEEYDTNFSYPHPYQHELDHFLPNKEQLETINPVMPKPSEESPLKIVSTKEDLIQMCDSLKRETEFAVDLEHHSYRTFQGITCLIQISTKSMDFIVDALELRSELHVLNETFTDPRIVKVFHGGDLDIQWLQRDFGVYVVNMFDTGQASRVLNFPRFSLAYLLKFYCDVDADKQYQLADWRIRPLPDELIKYAREDTHFLLYIYHKMKNELIEKGNNQNNLLLSTIQRSTQLCAQRYEKPRMREDAHKELFLRSKKVFNSRQLAALKGLYSWRDKTARAEDESTGYVLPNHMLLQIAEILPKEMQGVLACCNPVPPFVRQSLHAIHRIVRESREVPLTKPDVYKSSSMKPTEQQHPRYSGRSLLRCPHDNSHQGHTELRFPAVEPSNEPEPGTLEEFSILFGDGTIAADKSKPSLGSALGHSMENPAETSKLTQVQKLAAKIRSSFVSPLAQFLPNDKGGASLLKPAKLLASHLMWKLLPPTQKAKPQEEPVLTEVKKEEIVVELNDDGAIPLSQQKADVKKAISLKRKSEEVSGEADLKQKPAKFLKPGTSSGAAESWPPENRTPRSASTSKPLESWPPRSGSKPVQSWPPRASPAAASGAAGKKKKPTVEDLESSGFKAHDYSEDSFHMFTVKQERSTKDYDPSTQEVHSSKKGGRRANLNPKSGQKSMSFGKNSNSSKVQWPKK